MTWRGPMLAVAGLAALACRDDPAGPAEPAAPAIVAAAVFPVPGNVLAVQVRVRATAGERVVVRHGPSGAAVDSASPAAVLGGADDSTEVSVLGLLPETPYDLLVTVEGPGGTDTTTLAYTTGPLPPDLPRFDAGGPAPADGFVAFASGGYGLVIDNTGRVVWYVRFPDGPSLNFQPQPNGRYVARAATVPADGTDPTIEIDPLGRITRHLGCADGLTSRLHDVRVQPDGGYWILCDERRVLDLTPFGGLPDAEVIGTVAQYLDAAGTRRFGWSAFEHLDLADLDPSQLGNPVVNWTHGNAIEPGADGALYLSFRELDQVVRIDTASGAVTWRLGGSSPTLTTDGPARPFRRQHGLRVTASGAVVVLDNSGEESQSRAEVWVPDPALGRARLTALRTPLVPTRANLGGSTQLLPGGGMLVSYGDGGRVEEYDAEGRLAWEIRGHAGYVFRATRIRSLHDPGLGLLP